MKHWNNRLTGLALVLSVVMALPALAADFIYKQEFGQVQPRGAAQVQNPFNGPLIVSNIGSSGQDGVRFVTGSGGSIGPIRWMAPEALAGRGLNVVVDAEDPVGIPCAFAAAFTFDNLGGAVFVYDRLTSPATDLIVRAYRNGSPLFESQTTDTANPLFTSSAPPIGFGTTGPYLPIYPYDDSIFGWLFPGGTTVTLPGQAPVIADMVTFEFDPAMPELALLACEILGIEPQGAIGELLVTEHPSTQFHHSFGTIGSATAQMVDNLGSSGADSGTRISNIGSSGQDGVCVALNPGDNELGLHLEPMEATSGDVLSFGGLSLTPQPVDRTPLPKVTSHYTGSSFDVWTDVTVNDPPTAIRCYDGDTLVYEVTAPTNSVPLRVPAGSTSVQHPYRLSMASGQGGDRLTYKYAWKTPLLVTDGNGVDQNCDGIELEFVNTNKIGGPWYDWDAIELTALLILLGDIDINGAPNGTGPFTGEPIELDAAVALGAADIFTDTDGRLKVSNLGSSGCDGVSISPPGGGTGSGMGTTWALGKKDPFRGHVTVLKSHLGGGGPGGGGAGGVIRVGIAPADSNGTEWDVTSDFSYLGSAGVTYYIYNEGLLVDTIICAGTLEECLGLTAMPTSCETILDHPDGRPRMRLGLAPGTRYIDKSSALKKLELASVVDACYTITVANPPTTITQMDIQMGNMGGILFLTEANVVSGLSSVDNQTPNAEMLNLRAPRPNPFNPSTEIAFELARAADITLQVYDMRGQLVRELVRGARPAGEFRARWDGRDRTGRRVASGTYFFRLSGDGNVQARKAVLVK